MDCQKFSPRLGCKSERGHQQRKGDGCFFYDFLLFLFFNKLFKASSTVSRSSAVGWSIPRWTHMTKSRSTPSRFSASLKVPLRWLRRIIFLRPGKESGNSPFRMNSAHFPPTSMQIILPPISAQYAARPKSYIVRRYTTRQNIRTNRVKYPHFRKGVPCCAGAGSRGTEPWRHPTVPPPRGPSAGYGRPSRPFGLRFLTQTRETRRTSTRNRRPNAIAKK